MDQIQVDRGAIVELYRLQNLEALNDAVSRGEWTLEEAAQVHVLFMKSDVLQTLVSRDVEVLDSMLKGQVH